MIYSILRLYAEQNKKNSNFSQSRHNLKTLRLGLFRLSILVILPKNCWPRVLGSVVIQLYAGECVPSADRA